MRNIFKDITQFARSKSSREWADLMWQTLGDMRAMVRDNGEKAALIAFVVGIVVVVFFKLFLVVAAVAALLFLTLLWISDTGS